MAKIRIELEIAAEYADPTHDTGVTAEGWDELHDALSGLGDDIEITKAD